MTCSAGEVERPPRGGPSARGETGAPGRCGGGKTGYPCGVTPASQPVEQLLELAAKRTIGAIQAEAWVGGRLLHRSAHAALAGGAAVTKASRFDVASVTKVLATTAALLRLVDDGLGLDREVGDLVTGTAFGDRTIRQLLGHRAGLIAWMPWFEAARVHPACSGLWPGGPGGADRAAARRLTLEAALRTPPARPADEARVYSDLGFLALGEVVTAASGETLDLFARREVFERLALNATSFHPLPGPNGAVPTGALRPREPAPGQEGLYEVGPQPPKVVPGEVDDDNAWACGGVAGHAGVFSTATDVAAFGRLLMEDLEGAGRLARQETVASFMALDGPLEPARGLGFDHLARPRSSCGPRFGQGRRGGVGHLGFTGTSLWLDLDRGVVAVLLSNRTFPSRTNQAIGPLRAAFHDALVTMVDGD